jgi:hypothetical protein
LTEGKRFSLIKPTLQTCFHIDFDWWSKNDRSWRVYLRSELCPDHQKIFEDMSANEEVDWVDLVDAVFKIFLANGNMPLTPVELSERLSRPADTILKTFSGARVYKGIRPCTD